MAERTVVNASPLIVLSRARRLDLLTLAGTPAHVPETVAREVRRHSDDAARALDTIDWLRTVPDAERLPLVRGWDLGPGESAVLEWAQASRHRNLAVLVNHDDAAREFAYASSAATFEEDEPITAVGERLGWVVVSMKDDWETVFPAS